MAGRLNVYRQYRQQLTKKGVREKPHAISRLLLARVGQVSGERGMPFGRGAGGSPFGRRWLEVGDGRLSRKDSRAGGTFSVP